MAKFNRNRSKIISILFCLAFLICACNFPIPRSSRDIDSSTSSIPETGGTTHSESENEPVPSCRTDITLGITTKAEVITLLGEPIDTNSSSDVEFLLYSTSFSGQFNSIAIDNGVVMMINIILDEDDLEYWSTFEAELGEPVSIAYSHYMQGTNTYLYPQKGLAFVVNPSTDVVHIKQCFLPMDLSGYMLTWGSSLPEEDPFEL